MCHNGIKFSNFNSVKKEWIPTRKWFISLSIILLALIPNLALADTPPTVSVQRIYGQDRYQTALMVADQLASKVGIDNSVSQKFQAVVLASGNNWPDAICGTTLAYINHAPILLLDKTVDATGSQETFNYLSSRVSLGAKIFILGGKGVISDDFTQHLINMGYSASNIQQIGGANRDETSFMIAKTIGSRCLFTVSDENFYDAIRASHLEVRRDGSYCSTVLIPNNGVISDEDKNYLMSCEELGEIGDLCNTVDLRTLYPLENWGIFQNTGSEYATNSSGIGQYYSTVYLATGEDYPDALTGAVLADATESGESPIILVKHDSIPSESLKNLKDIIPTSEGGQVKNIVVLGGTSVVSDDVVNQFTDLVNSASTDEITSFKIENNPNAISQINLRWNDITISVPFNTDVTSLIPDITVSDGATISPKSGVAQDFFHPVYYTVTAKDGTKNTIEVDVIAQEQPNAPSVPPTGPNTQILYFSFVGRPSIVCAIDNSADTVTASVSPDTDVTALVPGIATNPWATISPSPDVATDFTNPVKYTISDENGNVATYIVTISKKQPAP